MKNTVTTFLLLSFSMWMAMAQSNDGNLGSRKMDGREYQILEKQGFIIYLADVGVTAPNGKAHELVKKYFFSTSLTTEILPLTIIDLKRVSSGNLKFHDSLYVEFSDGNNLAAFDTVHNMYTINYLLSQSITK
jgi:hypothetical protein